MLNEQNIKDLLELSGKATKKPREFWLEHCLTDDWPDWAVNDVPYGKQISGPREVIHVREVTDTEKEITEMRNNIEALCKIALQVNGLVEALEFYSSILNWGYLKGNNDFPWGRPSINYDDCNYVDPDTEWCLYGGKRARSALQKFRGEIGDELAEKCRLIFTADKHGREVHEAYFKKGFDQGVKAVIEMLRSSETKHLMSNEDYFADWIEQQLTKEEERDESACNQCKF